jgi:hypothetical protein
MQKAFAILAVLLIAGCGTQASRPSFLARSVQDCAAGDTEACAMLGSLGTVPTTTKQASAEPRPRSQSQRDADAILEGIRKARPSSPGQNMKIAPSDS